MGILTPWFFVFLLGFIPVIILYILKKEHKEHRISSTYLWDQVLNDIEVNKPFQKLNKHLLLLLQLICLLLMTLFLVKPFIETDVPLYNEVIFVVDQSASMGKIKDEKTLMTYAKTDMKEQLSGANIGTKYSLILVSDETKRVISQSTSKSQMNDEIDRITPLGGSDNFKQVKTLVDNILKVDDKVSIRVFSDKKVELGHESIIYNVYKSDEDNYAITSVVHKVDAEGIEVLVNMMNYTQDTSLETEMLVYNKDEIIDVMDLTLKPGVNNQTFRINDISIEELVIKLDLEDALKLDNSRYHVINVPKAVKVLLVSDGNYYLEKALNAVPGLEIYKSEALETEVSGYDLYIFDRNVPDFMPVDGNLFFVSPNRDTAYFEMGESIENGSIRLEKTPLTNHISEDFIVEDGSEIISKGSRVDIRFNERPIVVSGELKNVRFVVTGFSIFKSDFALKIGFPVFIQNVVEYALNNNEFMKSSAIVGEVLGVKLKPDVGEAVIRKPDGVNLIIAPPFPIQSFGQTDQIGIYTLEQKSEKESLFTKFAVNMDTILESANSDAIESLGYENINQKNTEFVKKDLSPWFILICIVVMLLEWRVYRDENSVD